MKYKKVFRTSNWVFSIVHTRLMRVKQVKAESFYSTSSIIAHITITNCYPANYPSTLSLSPSTAAAAATHASWLESASNQPVTSFRQEETDQFLASIVLLSNWQRTLHPSIHPSICCRNWNWKLRLEYWRLFWECHLLPISACRTPQPTVVAVQPAPFLPACTIVSTFASTSFWYTVGV